MEIIFKKSLRSREVPEECRTATIMPIFKKGTKSNLGYYRLLSLTSALCGILESIIKDGLMSHLLGNNLIKESQLGFMLGNHAQVIW